MVELHFERLPALLPCYLRALTSGRSASHVAGADIPDIRATTGVLSIDPGHLGRFRQLLGYPDDDTLPPTFPQVLATSLQLSLLTAKEFPLRTTGLVHLGNTISYSEAISPDEQMQLAASVSGASETSRGLEFSLNTSASVDGQVRWSASALVLVRRPGKRGQGTPAARRKPPEQITEIDRWLAEADIGRRYAAVSGDYNPIHLHKLTARAFGFKAPIAHGMWSLARCLASLHGKLNLPYEARVDFLRPLLLPAGLRLVGDEERPTNFSLIDERTRKSYLSGSIS